LARQSSRRRPLCASLDGFTLHARLAADDGRCFDSGPGRILFDRDASGKVVGTHIGGSGPRDMPFVRR